MSKNLSKRKLTSEKNDTNVFIKLEKKTISEEGLRDFSENPTHSAFSPPLKNPKIMKNKKDSSSSKLKPDKKQVCKRGSKLCKNCGGINPIHCQNCKHCQTEFPKKDKVGDLKDLLGVMNKIDQKSDNGLGKLKVTVGHLNQLKSYLDRKILKDETFYLGKRKDISLLWEDIAEHKLKELEIPLKSEGTSNSNSLWINGEKKAEFDESTNSSCLFQYSQLEKTYLVGKLAHKIAAFKLHVIDSNNVLMLAGLNLNDKYDIGANEDIDLFTMETQDFFGLKKLAKVGRSYGGRSLVGCFLINIKKEKKKEAFSLSLGVNHFLEAGSDIHKIEVGSPPDSGFKEPVILAALGTNGVCEIHVLLPSVLLSGIQGKFSLNSRVQINSTKKLDISIGSEIFSACKFIDSHNLLLGSQTGVIFHIKLTMSKENPSFKIISSFNHNKNFLVNCINIMPSSQEHLPSDVIFAVAWSDGYLKLFTTEDTEPIYEYQSMNVATFLSRNRFVPCTVT